MKNDHLHKETTTHSIETAIITTESLTASLEILANLTGIDTDRKKPHPAYNGAVIDSEEVIYMRLETPIVVKEMATATRSNTHSRQRNEQQLPWKCAPAIVATRTDNKEMANDSEEMNNSISRNAHGCRSNADRQSWKCGTTVKKWASSLKKCPSILLLSRPQSENYVAFLEDSKAFSNGKPSQQPIINNDSS